MSGIISIDQDGKPLWMITVEGIEIFDATKLKDGFWCADKISSSKIFKKSNFFGLSIKFIDKNIKCYQSNRLNSEISESFFNDYIDVIKLLKRDLEIGKFLSLNDAVTAFDTKIEIAQTMLKESFNKIFNTDFNKTKRNKIPASKRYGIFMPPSLSDLKRYLVPTSNEFEAYEGQLPTDKLVHLAGFSEIKTWDKIPALGIKAKKSFWVSNQTLPSLGKLTKISIIKSIIFKESKPIDEVLPFISELTTLSKSNAFALSVLDEIISSILNEKNNINDFLKFGVKSLFFELYCEQIHANADFIDSLIILLSPFEEMHHFNLRLAEPVLKTLEILEKNKTLSRLDIEKIKIKMLSEA